MSLASDVGNLVAHYRGMAAGYDTTNARLIDQSGNGLHAPKLAGTPAFAAYSGTTALTMRGDVYFGCPLIDAQPVVPLPTRFTVVAVFWANLASTDVFDFMMGVERDYDASDPAWQTPSATFENSVNAPFGLRLRANGSLNSFVAGSLNYPASGNFAAAGWNVAQFTADPDASQYKMRIGVGAWTSKTIPTGRQLQALDDWRLGYKATAIDTSSGHDFALAQLMIFQGDPANENSRAYSSLISALLLDPGAGDTQLLDRTTIGAAAAGSNSDITSLSGLTTPLSLAQGGTGANTQATARTALGLGSMATQSAGAVAITGGTVAGIADIAVADGGTGASTAAAARANLGAAAATQINTTATTAYTLASTDADTVRRFSNAGAITVTINAGTFTAPAAIEMIQMGAGQISLTAGSAVTIHTPPSGATKTSGQYAVGFLRCIGTDEYVWTGDLA